MGRRRMAMILVAALAPWPALAAQDWMLMGREGDCVELARAAAREAVLLDIRGPDQLAERLTRRGEKFRREVIAGNGVTVVQIAIPGRGMTLIFVPRSLCG